MEIQWLEEPEGRDLVAAESYLTLVLDPDDVATAMDALPWEKLRVFKAKDIFRASGLPLPNPYREDLDVESEENKIEVGIPLSPVLLVQAPDRLHVASGYYQLCAVFGHDPAVQVQCKLVYV